MGFAKRLAIAETIDNIKFQTLNRFGLAILAVFLMISLTYAETDTLIHTNSLSKPRGDLPLHGVEIYNFSCLNSHGCIFMQRFQAFDYQWF